MWRFFTRAFNIVLVAIDPVQSISFIHGVGIERLKILFVFLVWVKLQRLTGLNLRFISSIKIILHQIL